jgi:hypothetical protein
MPIVGWILIGLLLLVLFLVIVIVRDLSHIAASASHERDERNTLANYERVIGERNNLIAFAGMLIISDEVREHNKEYFTKMGSGGKHGD